ncbi:hypothetical protein FTX61_00365 [Nitriliruptoraceae bacterium ZYF776]|nr:hypothetical protein [Profundirhabdus halotolerans]
MTTADDVRELVERYFTALEAFDLDAVLACFTEDADYAHPPYPHDPPGTPHHEAAGHAALRALLEHRGPRSGRGVIDHVLTDGRRFALWGVLRGPMDRAPVRFAAVGALDPEGARVRSYAAFTSA